MLFHAITGHFNLHIQIETIIIICQMLIMLYVDSEEAKAGF